MHSNDMSVKTFNDHEPEDSFDAGFCSLHPETPDDILRVLPGVLGSSAQPSSLARRSRPRPLSLLRGRSPGKGRRSLRRRPRVSGGRGSRASRFKARSANCCNTFRSDFQSKPWPACWVILLNFRQLSGRLAPLHFSG